MKKIISGIVAASSAFSALPAVAADLGQTVNVGLNYGTATGLGTRDIREVIMLIINVILGFLAVIAIALIFFGTFSLMMSGGDEDKADKGKKLIVAGVIGLAIIFTSYAIAIFVVRSLVNVTV